MREHGCETLYTENSRGRKRPQWEAFINDLHEGDCAVLLSFDNAFYNFHDMIFFVKFCRKTGIRIVSIGDGLDTQDELFPESKTVNGSTIGGIRALCAFAINPHFCRHGHHFCKNAIAALERKRSWECQRIPGCD